MNYSNPFTGGNRILQTGYFKYADVNNVSNKLKEHLNNISESYSMIPPGSLFSKKKKNYYTTLALEEEVEITGDFLVSRFIPAEDTFFLTGDNRAKETQLVSNFLQQIYFGSEEDYVSFFSSIENSRKQAMNKLRFLLNEEEVLGRYLRFKADHYTHYVQENYPFENSISIGIYNLKEIDLISGINSRRKTEVRALVPDFKLYNKSKKVIKNVLDRILEREYDFIDPRNPFQDI